MTTGPRRRALIAIAAVQAALAAVSPPARAQVLWIELSHGDFSGDRFNPTPLALNPGSNQLFGVLAGDDGQGGYDRDYFSITVPDGHVLAQINLDLYLSADFASFIGIQPGPIFPDDPETVSAGDLLGWVHFGPSQQGADLLAVMGTHGRGFIPPLPAGTYSLWAQQIDDFTEYTLDFVVEVPEPSSLAILAAGAAWIGCARCRRRSAASET